MSADTHLVEINNITKHYKMGEITIKAVDGISFNIDEGSFTVVVGTSGAGKTTVLNILGGMDSCTSGSIRIGGREISNFSEKELVEYRRHDIGFVFQFYNLIPNLTARENVELAGQICKHPMPAEEALRSVGLEDRMDNFPAQLSGGEQQRVSIARALSKRPKLLLCDEPTGALDYNTGKMILKLLQQKSREDGLTVVLITHNLAITPMADRVIKLQSGKVESDTINENPLSVDLIEW
ncbi:MAG: ABC transporter ATP-binding protein [Ruminococcaceae bacterium]|nr:ABC transporter ATP-binding protein [Oscillospiraceae bacterium]